MSAIDVNYQQRIVVFLDFLGFKDHIQRTIEDPAHVARVADAFETIREFTKSEDGWQDREVSQFSDCVVVSYAVDQRSAAFDLLLTVLLLQVELASQGFLVRGGITTGPLLHRAGNVFGPALVDAYRMESKEAIHPRILVDPALVDVARDYPAIHHSGTDEARYVEQFLKQDDDGKFYLEYVSWEAVVGGAGADSDGWPGYMLKLSHILRDGLASNDPTILQKILWLHHQYRAAIEHFFVPPRAPQVIAKHQGYYDALAALPTLDAEAAAAAKIAAAKV